MHSTVVCKMIFSKQFCVFFIIIHVICFERTLAKYTQSRAELVRKVNSIQNVAMSSQKTQKFSRLEQLKAFRWRIKDCVEHTKNSTWGCFKISTLHAFDELTAAAVIPIWSGVRFVLSKERRQDFQIKDDPTYERQDLQHITLFDSLAMRLAKILHTHVLEMNLKEITEAFMRTLDEREAKQNRHTNDTIGEARHRRQRFNMMITMMFGVTALGAVLVPMGFQLLSIVSGKALLLAKMALLLASINGLKRVANSGVHYGLYQVPNEHYGAGYYDRNDLHHPRNVASVALAAHPIEYGIRK